LLVETMSECKEVMGAVLIRGSEIKVEPIARLLSLRNGKYNGSIAHTQARNNQAVMSGS